MCNNIIFHLIILYILFYIKIEYKYKYINTDIINILY